MSPSAGQDLSAGGLAGHALRFGGPLALGMSAHGIFNLVDMVIVARLGPGAVASVTIGGILLPLAMVLFDGVNTTSAALIAQFRGSGRGDAVVRVAKESLRLSLLASMVLGAAFFALAGRLVGFFEIEDEAVFRDAVLYLRIMSAGILGMFLILQTTAILRGLGNSLWPLLILVGANVLNVVLDLLLVFGLFGFPKLGVAGAAYATVISQLLGAGLGWFLIWRGCAGIKLRGVRFERPWKHLRTLLLLGLPTSLQLATRVLAIFLFLRTARLAAIGNAEDFLDGVGICVRLEMIAVFVGLGWAAAATPLVGQNLGARKPERAARGTWWLCAFAAASMALVGVLLRVFERPILVFVMPEISERALAHAHDYIRSTAGFYGLIAISLVISRALNGAGSTKTALILDVLLYLVILLPLSALSSGPDPSTGAQNGAIDSYRSLVFVHSLAALLYVSIFVLGRWKSKSLFGAAD